MLRRKKGRGERRRKAWRKEKDDRFSSERKERREMQRRKRNLEESVLEETYPVRLEGDDNERKRSIFRRMEYVLSTAKSSSRYGPRSKQNADFSACIGYTCNTIGLNGFKTPHNLRERKHLGRHLFHPENHRAPWWLKEMWRLSQMLIPLYKVDFGGGMKHEVDVLIFFFFLFFFSFFLTTSLFRILCSRFQNY